MVKMKNWVGRTYAGVSAAASGYRVPRYIQTHGSHLCTSLITKSVYPLVLETVEPAFGRGIDAPMSRNIYLGTQPCNDKRIKFSYDVTLQTSTNFFVGHAVG